DLRAPVTTRGNEESRCAPAIIGAASRNTAAMLGAEYESALQHRGNDGDALRVVEHFLRDAGVRRSHKLVHYFAAVVETRESFVVVLSRLGRGVLGFFFGVLCRIFVRNCSVLVLLLGRVGGVVATGTATGARATLRHSRESTQQKRYKQDSDSLHKLL